MIAIKHVLCPIDLSECSRRALHHAVGLARRFESRLTVLHTYQLVPLAMASSTDPPVTAIMPPVDEAELRQEVSRFIEPALAAKLPVEISVQLGDPIRTILGYAHEHAIDLLVMGTHGRGGVDRLVLGSVAEKVIRKAGCPVLTVPPASGPQGVKPVSFKRILCPVDFSSSSLKGLEYALSLAQEDEATITLLHVLEWPHDDRPPPELFDAAPLHRYLEEESRKRLSAAVPESARDWCRPNIEIVWGKPHRVILRRAREEQAELIVMGVLGRGALDLMLFGSTTHHVVRESTCPVLTVRGG